MPTSRLSRAEGCLMGQLAGDSLGSLVEFLTPAAIRARYPHGPSRHHPVRGVRPGDIRTRYPHGLRDLADGGTWTTPAKDSRPGTACP